jgi:NADH dehydrogenase [ubiquinone] 1 alpha subcomplex assembly factor 1
VRSEADDMCVFDFSKGGLQRSWSNVDDVVMGGVSASRFEPTEDGTHAFRGELSLEHGGGFASVRTTGDGLGLEGAQGLVLAFRGDGKTYELRLRMSADFDAISYRVAFATRAGQWLERDFPFGEFEPVRRGRAVPDAAPLEPGRVCGVGFLIADRQAGPFRLELASLSKR